MQAAQTRCHALHNKLQEIVKVLLEIKRLINIVNLYTNHGRYLTDRTELKYRQVLASLSPLAMATKSTELKTIPLLEIPTIDLYGTSFDQNAI